MASDGFTLIGELVQLANFGIISKGLQDVRYSQGLYDSLSKELDKAADRQLMTLDGERMVGGEYAFQKIRESGEDEIVQTLFSEEYNRALDTSPEAIDKDHEREAFILSLKVKEITKGVNEYYPESTYLEFIDLNKEFPKMKNEIFEDHLIFSTSKYQNVEELILNEINNGLTHMVVDNNYSQRPEYINEIFVNENKFEFLKKVYDSNEDGFNYHIKIFEINDEKFHDYIKKNKLS